MDDQINLDNPFGMEEFVEGEDIFGRALANVAKTAEGRVVLWEILSRSHIYDDAFHGNSHDIFAKGKRDVGLWLIAYMNEVDPTLYPQMLLDVAKQAQRFDEQEAKKEKTDERKG